MKIIYRVWAESCEERSQSDEIWTERDLIDAYYRHNVQNPCTIKEFEDEKEAEAFYAAQIPSQAIIQSTCSGHVVLYEVVGLDKVTLDEDGDEIDWDTEIIRAEGNDDGR